MARRRWIIGGITGVALLAALLLLIIAAFPFSLMKDEIAQRIGGELGTTVSIGSIDRRETLSFTPTILVRDLAIRQPQWAGQGDMVRAETIEARLPILPLLFGGNARPEGIVAHGLSLALVRDRQGRANWQASKKSSGDKSGKGSGLDQLVVPDGRISLRDEKRFLTVSGTITSDAKGLAIATTGRFHDKPARLSLSGGRIAGLAPDAPYPLHLDLLSPLLHLKAEGQTRGALNLRAMTLDVHAVAPDLKYLDDVIEAGLFNTRAIDLTAKVRHDGRDWFVDRLAGRIGRSTLTGRANALKRDDRTKIDADIHFSAFDFDDLSSPQGQAKAEAVEARIGERVLPGTRINLAKIGPTDGVVRFRADRLLLPDSAFRSLAGVIRLDGKLLTMDNVVAGMTSGRMTGGIRIDQRGGAVRPRLSIDLAFTGSRLETLIGTRDATGPLQGRVILSGTGDTIRDALARADGRAGLIVRNGTVKRTFAAVLGQDLGKAISAALGDRQADVPLRCLAVGFNAKGGIMTPAPMIVDTEISVGQGAGHLSLATESIALTIRGRSRAPSALRLVDPISVGGTFTTPTLSAAGTPPGSKVEARSVFQALGKSIGQALGLGKDKPGAGPAIPEGVNCAAMAKRVL